MSNSERDSHFQNFARLFYQDICDELGNYFVISEDLNEKDRQAFETLVARRAYDLAFYVATSLEKFDFATYVLTPSDEEAFALMRKAIADIPDMAKLP